MITEKSKRPANSLKQLNIGNPLVSKTDLYKISPNLLIEEEGFNTRGLLLDDYWNRPEVREGLMPIAHAYLRGDHVAPIVVQVRDGLALVRDGHRRRRALMIAINELGADIQKIDVIEHQGDEAAQTLLIATSNDGTPLTTLERAEIYCRLAVWGWSDAMIGARVGRTSEHIRQMRKHASLPIEMKRMIQLGQVSATYAQELFDKNGSDAIQILKAASEANTGTGVKSDGRKKPTRITKVRIAGRHVRIDPIISEKAANAFATLSGKLQTPQQASHSNTFLLEVSEDEIAMLRMLSEKFLSKDKVAPTDTEVGAEGAAIEMDRLTDGDNGSIAA